MRVFSLLSLMALALLAGCGKPEDRPTGAGDARSSAVPGPAAPAAGFHIVRHLAAHDGIKAPMVVVEDVEAAGGKCVQVPVGAGDPPEVQGRLELAVDIPAAGKANIWLRVKWSGECSNSVTLRLPGQPPFEIGQNATYNAWHWVRLRGPAVPLPAGVLNLALEQREDGVAFDQLLLTTDLDFVPVGIEE